LAFHRPCTLWGAACPARAGGRATSMARELEPHQSKAAEYQPKEKTAAASAEKSPACPTCPKQPQHGVTGWVTLQEI